MKYSIVIPTYNHCDDLLKPCIESIIKYTNMADIEIIISANGCTDNTKSYVESLQKIHDNIKLIWSDKALGYPKATNLGIKASSCQKIVLLNNDCQLLFQNKSEWLQILENPFIENSKCGISCIIKEYSQVMKHPFAVFFCVMIDKNVFDLNSKNNLACTIVHESKHLEIESWKTKMTEKKEEYFAYLTEYAFFSKLKDGEDWLREFLVNMMIEYQ